MARRHFRPKGNGPVVRMPWSDDAWPGDWGRGKRKARRSPRPGARTGPVRGKRR
jgi:hypothetical protein